MAERSEITETNTAADPAAQAFEALRQEIALLRRAVTGLAADQSSIEVPDYSETLAKISGMVSSIGKRLVALSETPAFGYTPHDWSLRSKRPAKKPGAKTGRRLCSVAKFYGKPPKI
jgi:hypothetical protein